MHHQGVGIGYDKRVRRALEPHPAQRDDAVILAGYQHRAEGIDRAGRADDAQLEVRGR